MICAAVRALAALATQCRDHVTFCRTPHAGADRLWRETSRRDGADRLAEQEAEQEVSEPWMCSNNNNPGCDNSYERCVGFCWTFVHTDVNPIADCHGVPNPDDFDRLAEQEAEEECREPAWTDALGDCPPLSRTYDDEAPGLAFSAAKPTIACPNCGCQLTMTYRMCSPARTWTADGDRDATRPFGPEKPTEDTVTRIAAYPPFNPLNHESSSVDGEAATVAGPPTEGSPVASVSADLDATGPPTCGSERHHRPAIHARCSRPTGHDGMHGYVDIFWRDKDPEK